ncbi:hypothetical protein Tco_1128729 [Tanacetum coccineum]
MTRHKGVYVTPSHTKKVFVNMKRPCKGFSGRVTSLFSTMMVQATEDMCADLATPTDSHSIPIISQPSSYKPQKKKSRRKQRKDSGPAKPVTDEDHVSTPSYDPPQSGEDNMQLFKLMNLCISLQEKVLDLEKAKTAQAKDITSLKKRVKQLEKRRKSRPSGLRRLRKGRKIEDLDADAEITLVNETQELNDDNLMFDTDVLEDVAEVVTTVSANVEILNELTLAQTLIEIKNAKPKPVTTALVLVDYAITGLLRGAVSGLLVSSIEEWIASGVGRQCGGLLVMMGKGGGAVIVLGDSCHGKGIANMANAPCDVVGLRERDGLSGVVGIEVKIDRDDKQCNWQENLVLYVLGITGYKFVV